MKVFLVTIKRGEVKKTIPCNCEESARMVKQAFENDAKYFGSEYECYVTSTDLVTIPTARLMLRLSPNG